LHQMLAAEEQYLASAMPTLAVPATLVSSDESMARVPGRPVPGRPHGDPNAHVPVPVAPTAPVAPQTVSTSMPLTGAPAPAPVAPQAPESPTTQSGLKSKIESQLAAMGVRTGA
jgi:hypothetical protein